MRLKYKNVQKGVLNCTQINDFEESGWAFTPIYRPGESEKVFFLCQAGADSTLRLSEYRIYR